MNKKEVMNSKDNISISWQTIQIDVINESNKHILILTCLSKRTLDTYIVLTALTLINMAIVH